MSIAAVITNAATHGRCGTLGKPVVCKIYSENLLLNMFLSQRIILLIGIVFGLSFFLKYCHKYYKPKEDSMFFDKTFSKKTERNYMPLKHEIFEENILNDNVIQVIIVLVYLIFSQTKII